MTSTKFVDGGKRINEDQSEVDYVTDAVRRSYEAKEVGPVEALAELVRASTSQDVNCRPEWGHVDTLEFVLKLVMLVPTDPIVQDIIAAAGAIGKVIAVVAAAAL